MHAFIELLAEFASGLLPMWIQRHISARYQIWATLGCTLVVLAVVGLVLVFFASR